MKHFSSFFFVAILLVTEKSYSQSSDENGSLAKFEWLIGQWQRQGMKPGTMAHERWEPDSGNVMHGWGISFRGQDTTFVEKLKIIEKDGAIYYVADVRENEAPVLFIMTEISADGFLCENATHDFPKKISYRREGDILKATISGGSKEITFEFVKTEPVED